MDVSVKIVSRPQIKVPELSVSDMYVVGQTADDLMTARVDSPNPRDVNNQAAPPLSPRYKIRKERKGKRGVREMYFPGAMLTELGTFRAQKGYVFVGFKSSTEYMKAWKQQQRFEWFGLADQEEAAVVEKAQNLYANRTAQLNAGSYGIL